MRIGALVIAACVLVMPAVAAAQTYSGSPSPVAGSVLRPASTVGWRNYTTAPDGPCGPPMSVQTDCYDNCRPCGPLHPLCFLHRVGRMLDCLLPCNLCCGGGWGNGPYHGCHLGGRTWGHCGVCCGGGGSYGGDCGGGGACCPNPCGSAFAPCCTTPSCSTPSYTTGGHCHGCSSALPGLSDPFQDDPLPPKPTAAPAEVRQRAPQKLQTAAARPQARPAAPTRTSPYKIVGTPANVTYGARPMKRTESTNAGVRKANEGSVLRRASAEESVEPAQLQIDHSQVTPIIRSQSPDEGADESIPHNPLRR